MQVTKAADAGTPIQADAHELAQINLWSRKKLGAEEVYAFCVRLCDNEVDRDGERFPEATLEALAGLFVGKSGVFDHQWSAKGQAARIYRTQVIREEGALTSAGDGYCWLKGYAYMLRTAGNKDLIAEIEGGIKKEVSVGCAVERSVCSICGADMRDRKKCTHEKGSTYGGKLCWAELTGATDAYEWSFVAVPAQKNAGVVKGMKGGKHVKLKDFLKQEPEYLAQLQQLEAEAEAGRRYLGSLRAEVQRLGGLCEPGLNSNVLERISERLDAEELEAIRKNYESRLDTLYPPNTQLTYRGDRNESGQDDGAFLI